MKSFHKPETLFITKVRLLVHSLKRSLEFYQDILGFYVTYHDHKNAFLSADQTNILIELLEDSHAKPLGLTQGLYHYAILVHKRSDLAGIIKRLINHRYPISGASDHGVSEAIYLDDPDGHGIEIYTDRTPDEWPQENDALTMYTRPLDINSLMMELESDVPSKMPSLSQMGHIHLHVPNLEEAKKFYMDTLGFELVMMYGESALFISDQKYHHHIGLNTWLKDAPLCEVRQIGLKAYFLNVPKSMYLALLKRLDKAHITLLEDDDGHYVIDPLNQKLVFLFQS
ncbi:MAG: VOC family protein [Acholeplasmataceae bacterium]|jgi:catechol 2,3-dioxygenase|nr:VOC family protein [Acholeplasmataceae bacterium]